MSSQDFIKKITSKDINLSKNTIKTMVKAVNLDDFSLLCQKSDFIFPFLKERIIKDFVNLIDKENLSSVFEFSRVYCFDFEDLIVNSWLKFASEDLTDEILELFEKGTNEQKAYCAKYFSKIQDNLALEYLKKEANSEFEPLRINCAQALFAFRDVEVLNIKKEIILNSQDEFEKYSAFSFIIAYGGEENIKFVIENCFKSSFCSNIISQIMDFCDFDYLKNILDKKTLLRMYQLIFEQYPEDISLDTVYYWQILDFSKLIYSYQTKYSNNLLLQAKAKITEYVSNDIYTFDLDKNLKIELKNLLNYLNSLELSKENLLEIDLNDEFELDSAFKVIEEYKLDYSKELSELFNQEKLNYEKMACVALILKDLGKIDLLSKEAIEKIDNENIKILITSYFS